MYIQRLHGDFGRPSVESASRHMRMLDEQGYSGTFHVVDVFTTASEWQEQRLNPEPQGWTYIVDDEGLDDISDKCYKTTVFDAYEI